MEAPKITLIPPTPADLLPVAGQVHVIELNLHRNARTLRVATVSPAGIPVGEDPKLVRVPLRFGPAGAHEQGATLALLDTLAPIAERLVAAPLSEHMAWVEALIVATRIAEDYADVTGRPTADAWTPAWGAARQLRAAEAAAVTAAYAIHRHNTAGRPSTWFAELVDDESGTRVALTHPDLGVLSEALMLRDADGTVAADDVTGRFAALVALADLAEAAA